MQAFNLERLLKQPLVKISAFGYLFSPSWRATILYAIGVYVLFQLGIWQLNRAEFKTELLNDYQAHSVATPLSFKQIGDKAIHYEFYQLRLTGTYDSKRSLLLDNAIVNHQVGYWVLTPFYIEGQLYPILINRGWIARGFDRQHLPRITTPTRRIQLTGLIKLPPTKTFTLSNARDQSGWPAVIESLNFAEISQLLGEPLQPYMLLLSANQATGFHRNWQPDTNMPAARHKGYAIQWFALALTLAIIYLAVNIRRQRPKS